MKRNFFTIILLAFTFSTILFSCKKKSNSIIVEYRITPINNSITKITYNDITGAPVIITNPAQFGTGSTFVSIKALPYTAKISIEVNNQTISSIVYDLRILVNGQIMKLESGVALPMSASTILSAEYVVQ